MVSVAIAAIGGGCAARWPLALLFAVALGAAVIGVDGRSRSTAWPVVAVIVLVCVASALRADAAWDGLAPDAVGEFDGWVRLIDDPQPVMRATRVIVEVDGERFEVFARGRAGQLRVRTWRGGELVRLRGERVALSPERANRVAWQHVVGELRVDWVGDVVPGTPLAVASNRVRAAIERGSAAASPR